MIPVEVVEPFIVRFEPQVKVDDVVTAPFKATAPLPVANVPVPL